MRRQSGFTLIELLVVIAIIAILAAILFPVFGNAKKAAQLSACTSNMSQFAKATMLYRESFNGNLPQAGNIWYIYESNTPQYNYFEELHPYMKSTDVAICPSKPITSIKDSLVNIWYVPGTGQKSKWYGAVYTPPMWAHAKGENGPRMLAHMVWSQGDTVVNPDTVDFGGKYKCPRPSEAVMMFCLSGTWSITWDDSDIRQTYPDGIAHGSHERGTPAIFADGHVKFVEHDRVGNL